MSVIEKRDVGEWYLRTVLASMANLAFIQALVGVAKVQMEQLAEAQEDMQRANAVLAALVAREGDTLTVPTRELYAVKAREVSLEFRVIGNGRVIQYRLVPEEDDPT